MFPADPWSEVEPLATDLIQRLLKVNVRFFLFSLFLNEFFQIEERLTIEQCLAHPWLKSEQLYRDLRSLEIRLNLPRYVFREIMNFCYFITTNSELLYLEDDISNSENLGCSKKRYLLYFQFSLTHFCLNECLFFVITKQQNYDIYA